MTLKFSKLVSFAQWSFVVEKKEKRKKKKTKQNLKPDKKTTKNKKEWGKKTVLALQSSLQNAFSALELPEKATLLMTSVWAGELENFLTVTDGAVGTQKKHSLK